MQNARVVSTFQKWRGLWEGATIMQGQLLPEVVAEISAKTTLIQTMARDIKKALDNPDSYAV